MERLFTCNLICSYWSDNVTIKIQCMEYYVYFNVQLEWIQQQNFGQWKTMLTPLYDFFKFSFNIFKELLISV